jgi:hypothetical protein
VVEHELGLCQNILLPSALPPPDESFIISDLISSLLASIKGFDSVLSVFGVLDLPMAMTFEPRDILVKGIAIRPLRQNGWCTTIRPIDDIARLHSTKSGPCFTGKLLIERFGEAGDRVQTIHQIFGQKFSCAGHSGRYQLRLFLSR